MNASARLAILACGALLACGTSSAAKHPATTADAVADGAEPVDAAAEVTPVFVTLPLRADGHFLRAADGRAVFLRGLNVSNAAKYEPTHNGTASAKAFAQMAGWGFNTVRLLTFWGAVMTAPPGAGVEELQPDPVYLAQLDQRIAEAADAGLLVVLDMHQDIFGFGFGDNGAPPAACDVKISTLDKATKLKNLVTGELVEGKLPSPRGWHWQNETAEERVSFSVHLPPHSYAVFALAGARETASASAH